jgi:L,D-transpeptidase catalytic domain
MDFSQISLYLSFNMKKLFFSLILAGSSVPLVFLWVKPDAVALFPEVNPLGTTTLSDGPKRPDPENFTQKIAEAATYCKKNGLNTEASILIDLGLHSGSYRCFVVRLADASIRIKGLVTHGSGKTGLLAGERKYSNEEGSLLSSLGKYKTGASYKGQFGLAWKLYGLEATNSKAYSRYIVLHGHECVPDAEIEDMLCQSWGCPTVSPEFLKQLQKVIDGAQKPLLLWIYDSSGK